MNRGVKHSDDIFLNGNVALDGDRVAAGCFDRGNRFGRGFIILRIIDADEPAIGDRI